MPFTVAIVEDEESFRILLKKILVRIFGERASFLEATTVEEAQQLLKEHRPALFLVDGALNSKGVWNTGPLISSILAEKGANPGYKCTMIAISGDENSNRKMVAAGCDMYINKDRVNEELIDKVATVVGS